MKRSWNCYYLPSEGTHFELIYNFTILQFYNFTMKHLHFTIYKETIYNLTPAQWVSPTHFEVREKIISKLWKISNIYNVAPRSVQKPPQNKTNEVGTLLVQINCQGWVSRSSGPSPKLSIFGDVQKGGLPLNLFNRSFDHEKPRKKMNENSPHPGWHRVSLK